jgi:hypothetical protein
VSGHRCSCECAASRARSAYLDRAVSLWIFAAFVGSCTLWSLVLPESTGAWVWIPILLTWFGVTAGPVLVCRWLVRRRARATSVAVRAYRGGSGA